MELMLKIIDSQNSMSGVVHQAVVDEDVFSIGRGEDSSWYLPDPQLHISAKHCVIHRRNNEFHLTDISTNGVYINGADESVGRGRSVILNNTDVLGIGEYQIEVNLESSLAGMTGVEQTGLKKNNEVISEELDSDAVIAELLTNRQNGQLSGAFSGANERQFAKNLGNHTPPERMHFTPPVASFDSSKNGNSDLLHGRDGGSESATQVIPDDWMVSQEQRKPSVRTSVNGSSITSHTSTPIGKSETVKSDDSVPSYESAGAPSSFAENANDKTYSKNEIGNSSDPILDLILTTAGINSDLTNDLDNQKVAKIIGSILKSFSQGLVETMASRSLVKSEFRLQQTTIRPVDNNPLKFSPNGSDALKILFFSDTNAYLSACESVDESFQDIQAHQLAMMTGIQASLSSLLDKFNPGALEDRFNGKNQKSASLFSRNTVDNWLEYKDYYSNIRELMEEGFSDLFTSEFGRAYEAQLRKLKT